MFVTRRQFLLSTAGASVGAIIPSFYFRALEFFEQFGEPLLETPGLATQDLCVLDNCGEYLELCVGDPFADMPPMTFREYFTRYDPDGLVNYDERGIETEEIDSELPEEFRWDVSFMHDGPPARAYHMLQKLDLGKELAGPGAVGGLNFVQESNMTSTWVSARARDEVTLSLLQKRLNDLGTGIRVVTGYSL